MTRRNPKVNGKARLTARRKSKAKPSEGLLLDVAVSLGTAPAEHETCTVPPPCFLHTKGLPPYLRKLSEWALLGHRLANQRAVVRTERSTSYRPDLLSNLFDDFSSVLGALADALETGCMPRFKDAAHSGMGELLGGAHELVSGLRLAELGSDEFGELVEAMSRAFEQARGAAVWARTIEDAEQARKSAGAAAPR